MGVSELKFIGSVLFVVSAYFFISLISAWKLSSILLGVLFFLLGLAFYFLKSVKIGIVDTETGKVKTFDWESK